MIRAAAVLAAALTSAACSATRQEAGQVDHVVLLWLKAPGDRSALTRVEQTVRGFADQLPEPTSVTLGAPLLDDHHVQNDYHAAFVFNFVLPRQSPELARDIFGELVGAQIKVRLHTR